MSDNTQVVLSSDGVPIQFEVVGGGRPALVFVHGWCCDRSYWKGQIAHFAPNRTVVALDLAGHGSSGTGRAQYTMPLFGRDVVAVIEKLDLQRVVLVGHSMGGPVIVEAARCIPSRLAGLIGADTWWDVSEHHSKDVVEDRMAPFRGEFVSTTQRFVRSMFVPNSDPALVERIVAGMSSASPRMAVEAQTSDTAGGDLLRDGLRVSKVPRVAINAEAWRPTNLAAAKDYGIEVKLMSGVGHFVMLEDPLTFNRHIMEAVHQFSSDH